MDYNQFKVPAFYYQRRRELCQRLQKMKLIEQIKDGIIASSSSPHEPLYAVEAGGVIPPCQSG